jgi:glycerophosphoryl diester phosphodiesterase
MSKFTVATAIFLATAFSCNVISPKEEKTIMLDIQGHRGCRGLMPENTIPAFVRAVELGVNTLELDVVVTKDKQVLVSHESYLNHEICYSPEGKELSEKEAKSYNLYQMTYEEIKKCDCGSRPHPRFPQQQNLAAHKPLLSEVIDSVEQYITQNKLPPVNYNIEIKSTPSGDEIFHPKPTEFTTMVVALLEQKEVVNRANIQSFDVRPLQYARKKYPDLKLALLVENDLSPEENIYRLGFFPHIYSPDFPLVNRKLLQYAHLHDMQVIPWTINEDDHIRKMLELGVDGIISDYPDRVIKLSKKQF